MAGEMLRQITEVYAARAEWMMSGWELHHNPQEPVVNLDGYAELFAQSLSLDLGELFEAPDVVVYPSDRKGRLRSEGTVVGVLLGGYGLEQRGEFYQRETICVEAVKE
jgi:hypothetical protein